MDTFDRDVIEGYRIGMKADVVQFAGDRGWGVVYTIPPASVEMMERVGLRFVQLQAHHLRLARRARLRRAGSAHQDVVIVTELPARSQRVWDAVTGRPVRVRYLQDQMLIVLERAIGLSD